MWKQLTMKELWEILAEDMPDEIKKVFILPEFPTRRWGKCTTKTTTAEIDAVNKALIKLKERGIKARKRIDGFDTKRFKMKMYKIEIKTT